MRGCTLLNSHQQFILYYGMYNTVEESTISGGVGDCMHILGWNNTFRRNEVYGISYSEGLHTDIFQTIGSADATWSDHVFEGNYVHDCDAAWRRAVEAGARSSMEPADMFWGDRTASVTDPFGYVWNFATHVKDLTDEEIRRAGEEFARKMASGSTRPRRSPSARTAGCTSRRARAAMCASNAMRDAQP